MALDIQRMLGQLSPARPIDLGGSSGAREQLRLARERFEFEKQQAQKEKELRLLEEQGRMARERMQQERLAAEEKAKLEAQQQAALLAQQQAALGKAGELAGTGKGQQFAAMSPLMDQLGYDMRRVGNGVFDFVNRQQEQAAEDQAFDRRTYHAPRPEMEGGERPGFYALPRDIDTLDGSENAVQSLERLAALGYPTNERGTLDDENPSISAIQPSPGESLELEPQVSGVDEATADALAPGDADMATAEEFAGEGDVADVSVRGRGLAPASLSTGDAFARALAAQRYALETGKPARAPDEEDYMGAVPRNRIDMPAMAAETLARLKPALDARVMALPDDLRPAARRNADAIGGLGLEATDALAEHDKAMDDAVSIYNSQQNLLAEQAKRQTPSMMDVSTFRTRGADAAKELADKRGVSKVLEAVVKADEVLRVLDDPTPENDRMIAPALMAAQGVEGVPSNTDLQFAFNAKSSAIGDIIAAVEEAINGGLSTVQRRAIRDYLKAVRESQRQVVDGYLDSAFQRLDSGEFNEHEARGYKGYIEQSVPAAWYNEYWDKREKAERSGERAPGRVGQNAPAAAGELQRQAAAAGLNGQVLGQLMGGESGGNPKAANEDRTDGLPKSSAKGVFQLLDSTAQAMGFKDAAEYSAQPLEKQIEVGLKLFKNKGLKADSPAEDYALVLAAPSKVGKWKSRDEVVYEADSPELAGNPGWRSAPGGAATVGSITDYYLKAGKQRAADADEAERKADPANPYPDDAKATELLKRL